jgi:hypothetical protein
VAEAEPEMLAKKVLATMLAFAEADGILQCLEQAYFKANESR